MRLSMTCSSQELEMLITKVMSKFMNGRAHQLPVSHGYQFKMQLNLRVFSFREFKIRIRDKMNSAIWVTKPVNSFKLSSSKTNQMVKTRASWSTDLTFWVYQDVKFLTKTQKPWELSTALTLTKEWSLSAIYFVMWPPLPMATMQTMMSLCSPACPEISSVVIP